MTTPEKCPHCGAPVSLHAPHWFECGSHEDGTQTLLCRERIAHAETKAELEKVRAELADLRSRWDSAGTAVTAEITRIQGQRDKATNTIDLMRAEFWRIIARCVEFDGLSSSFTQEIRRICDRARFEIEQRTDVIVQRDNWQRRAERLERALILVAYEPNLDRARKIADEALEQKEAGMGENQQEPPDSRLCYGLDGWESLCDSVKEVVERYTEDALGEPQFPITVYEFKPMDPPNPEWALERLLECLDADFQTDDETKPTHRMLAGMQMILSDYRVGACDETGKKITVTAEEAERIMKGENHA